MALSGWQYKKKLTIDHTKIDADLVDFPVLVKLTSSNFDFSKAKSDGSDIRFLASDDTTLLSYEREKHDSTNQEAEYWVKVPSVSSASDTTFYIYYDNPVADDGANSTDVWDSNYMAVYHLSESGTAIRKDSTSNGNNGTPKGGVTGSEGKIDGANSFDGSNDYIQVANSSSLNASAITISALVKINAWSYGGIVAKGGGNSNGFLTRAHASNHVFQWDTFDGSRDVMMSGNTQLNLGQFYHFVATYEPNLASGNQKIFLNGTIDGSGTYTGGLTSTTQPVYIGKYVGPSGNNEYFNGLIDEVRISNIARSAAWIKASYNSENDTLLTYGAEENTVISVATSNAILLGFAV